MTEIPRDANSWLVSLTEQFQTCWDAMLGQDGNRLSADEHRLVANRTVDVFGQMLLMACLHRVDPAVADRAAKWLASELEAGDGLGEWMWEWQQQLLAGKPLTLRPLEGGEV
jgi:hypothetical protein